MLTLLCLTKKHFKTTDFFHFFSLSYLFIKWAFKTSYEWCNLRMQIFHKIKSALKFTIYSYDYLKSNQSSLEVEKGHFYVNFFFNTFFLIIQNCWNFEWWLITNTHKDIFNKSQKVTLFFFLEFLKTNFNFLSKIYPFAILFRIHVKFKVLN